MKTTRKKNKPIWFKFYISYLEDEKLSEVFEKYKYEGTGMFIEIIRLLYKYNGILEYDIDKLSIKMRSKRKSTIKDIIDNFDLFVIDESTNTFYNEEVNRQLNYWEKQVGNINKRWNKIEDLLEEK